MVHETEEFTQSFYGWNSQKGGKAKYTRKCKQTMSVAAQKKLAIDRLANDRLTTESPNTVDYNAYGPSFFSTRIHGQQITFHGDGASFWSPTYTSY